MHAHAAAMYAFNRAQERNGAGYGNMNELSQNSSTIQQNQSRSSQQNSYTNHDSPVLKRQQSVRFAGPNAVKRRQSTGKRTEAPALTHKPSTSSTLRPVAMTTNTPVPAVYRPPSRSSSIGKASFSKVAIQDYAAGNYVTNLAFDEYYTQEDDIASTPSSYRRIRKSKSMFSPLSAPSNVFYSNGSPDRTNCSSSPRTQENDISLRAPKSMSFLRGGRDYLKSGSSCERNDDAVQMARDRFFIQATQQRLREQPSFIFRSKSQRQEKPFRKSVRSSSGRSAPTYNSAESVRDGGLRAKARKVSQGLKSKLRKVFGRSKEEPIVIPNQQVDAIETHVRAYAGQLSPDHESFLDIPRPDEAAFAHVAARVPSLRAIASSQRLRSQSGSIRSFRSDNSDEKSRVTSWTNSTANNTVTSQGLRPQPSRDQRLSVINESGTHISKAAFHRPNVKNQHPAYPAFHRPGHFPPMRPGGVDSARLCSALMKRLDENSPEAILAKSKNASSDTLRAEKVPRRTSSFTNTLSQSKPWIRQVPPDCDPGNQNQHLNSQVHHSINTGSIRTTTGEDLFGQAIGTEHQFKSADLPLYTTQPQSQDDVFSSHPASSQTNSSDRRGNAILANIDVLYSPKQDPSGLTPQEIAERDDPRVPSSKVIREARSAFFGGTTFKIDRVGNTSPYRRALAESDNSGVVGDDPMAGRGSPVRSTPQGTGHDLAKVRMVPDDTYSESIYSRSTGRNLSEAMRSDTSIPLTNVRMPSLPVDSLSAGGAVIINSTTYRPTHSRHRGDDSGGSVEWKKWMSSEVARLERPQGQGNDRVSVTNIDRSLTSTPTAPNSYHVAHRREYAQMGDDDTDIAQKKPPMGKQPLGLIQQNLPSNNGQLLLKPILKKRSTTSLAENAYVDNAKLFAVPPAPPPPPSIPLRSTLRTTQSKTSLKSTSNSQYAPTTPSSMAQTQNTGGNGRNVLHKRLSSATLRSAPTTPNHSVEIQTASTRNVLHKRNVSGATMRSCKSIRSVKSFDTSVRSVHTTSPAKLVKRSGRPVYNHTPQSSPGTGIGAAVERQFGSANANGSANGTGRQRMRAGGRENERVSNGAGLEDVYGVEGSGLLGLDGGLAVDMQQLQLGSKQMVDLFLSSRRRRIASVATLAGGSMGGDEGGRNDSGMGDSSGVFL